MGFDRSRPSWLLAVPGVVVLTLAFGSFAADGEGADRDERLHAEVLAIRDVRVPAEVPGRVVKRPEDETRSVKAGEVIVALDEVFARAANDAAQAQARRALARRDWARTERERAVSLNRKGSLGKADLDQAILAAQEAEEALLAARAAAEEARTRLERTRIKAPFDGRLVRVYAEAGEYLSVGQTAFRVIDDSALKIVTYVPARWLPRLRVGGELVLVPDFDGARIEPLKARIFSVAPAAEGAARTFRVEARARDPKGAWRPGMTALARPRTREER